MLLLKAQRCADPARRSLEQSVNTVQRALARADPAVRARDSAQQAVAREDPVVRSLEQSTDTEQRALAREDSAVRARESSQQAVAREDPAVQDANPGDAAPDADATS